MEYILLSILILFAGGVLSLLAKNEHKMKICTLFSLVSVLLGLYPIKLVLFDAQRFANHIDFNGIFGRVELLLDPLSAFFYLVISVMSFVGILYANGYLKPYLQKGKNLSSHCFCLMLLQAAMLSVVTVQNSLFFLVVWELMSISSFFLVIFEAERKEVLSAGLKYLVYMHLSVIFLIACFAILANGCASLDFSVAANYLAQNPNMVNIVFILAFLGFGIKAGFVPFHNWLPDAHPAAPSHVSGVMSGVMIKTGIYGILRILLLVGVPTKAISYMVLGVALLTVLYGLIYAISQRDIKRLLAYSSIENIGIIGISIGVGMLGLAYSNLIVASFAFAGGVLHILNHAIFKEILFFTAGNMYLKTHTKNIELLGGLIKKMPYTATLFIIGSVAICGLPPFNGFISEFLIYAGMLLGIPASEMALFVVLVIAIAGLALVGTMAMLCFSKASGIVFLGEPRSDMSKKVEGDVGFYMGFPIAVLALLALIIGVFPEYFVKLALCPVSLFVNVQDIMGLFNSIVHLIQIISGIILVFLVILFVCFLLRKVLNSSAEKHSTWGCGYDKPNPHIQYTASSYVNLFVSTLKPLFKRVSHIKKPKELFPKEAYYELEIEDIEEAYIVKPLVKWDEKLLSKFEKIQNGNIQQYILFGLVFLVIAIIGLIWIG